MHIEVTVDGVVHKSEVEAIMICGKPVLVSGHYEKVTIPGLTEIPFDEKRGGILPIIVTDNLGWVRDRVPEIGQCIVGMTMNGDFVQLVWAGNQHNLICWIDRAKLEAQC